MKSFTIFRVESSDRYCVRRTLIAKILQVDHLLFFCNNWNEFSWTQSKLDRRKSKKNTLNFPIRRLRLLISIKVPISLREHGVSSNFLTLLLSIRPRNGCRCKAGFQSRISTLRIFHFALFIIYSSLYQHR